MLKVRYLLLILLSTTSTLFCLILTACGTAHINSLAVGKLATVHDNISLAVNGLRTFNDLKKSEILNIRSRAVAEHAQFVNTDYVPNNEVFGQIVDGRPWWGLEGLTFYGSGLDSSIGQSWHSQQICNPFSLIVADVYPILYRCDRVRFPSKKALANAGCPTRCQPSQISMNLDEAKGSVVYDISRYIHHANMFLSPALSPYDIGFNLEACNARDFDYNYLYVDPSQSSVVSNGQKRVVHITQFFGCDNSCGIKGGCNNMIPTIDALEHFKLAGVPARCHVLLWKDHPSDVVQTPPDFTFDIDFK